MLVKTFSIGETAKMTGVSEKQLRNWERSNTSQNLTVSHTGTWHTGGLIQSRSD
jgi:DNA-binding transcriptional MerR regulator